MLITKAKRYKTRYGLPVRLYDFWEGTTFPVIGAYKGPYGWQLSTWAADGTTHGSGIQSPYDLVEVKDSEAEKEQQDVFGSSINCY